jgi:ABC-2 type transport system permease protein
MRTLKFLLKKEFRQIFRNPGILRIMLIAPIIQLLILPRAADYEIKNINISIEDYDHSVVSQQLVNKITSSGYFKLVGYHNDYKKGYDLIERDKADIDLEIPAHFERNLVRNGSENLFEAVNAINGTKAIIGSGYLSSIIADYNGQVRMKWLQPTRVNNLPTIDITSSNWYNPNLVYAVFMVPGILVLLLTLVGGNLSAFNIVKEKEIGTIEQINVTPIKKHIFIMGKLIPFIVSGMVVFTLGMLIAVFVYGIIPVGSLLLLYLFALIYLITLVGFGLLISTYSETQQQAQSLTFFFLIIFNLMSGLFTSIDSMPHWAQIITRFIPLTYFIEVMRMIVLKGSNFMDVAYDFGILILMGIALNAWAIINYRKTT